MTRREPPDVAILAARLQRAWPSLSPYSAASLAVELCSIERAQRRHAERCCSGADGGYVRPIAHQSSELSRAKAAGMIPCLVEHDPAAEQRAEKRIERRLARWHAEAGVRMIAPGAICRSADIELQDDPRGPVLLLRLPKEEGMVPV